MKNKIIFLVLVALLSGCASKREAVPVYSVTMFNGRIGAADAYAAAMYPEMFRKVDKKP